jgi:hypothetical protein
MARCIVSYLATDGIRHSVEVEAESLYEAAVLAVRTFKRHACSSTPPDPEGLKHLSKVARDGACAELRRPASA